MRLVRLTLAALIAGACASAVDAQNVVFTNSQNAATGPYSIPLIAGSTVVVDPSGNLKAQCQLEADGKRCVGIPSGTSGENPPPVGAPVVSLSSSVGSSVNVGTSFTVNGSATNSPESCVRSSSPAASGWDGAVLPGLASTNVSFGAAGTYSLKLRCFNAAGAGENSISMTAQATQQPPPVDPGTEPAACANIRQQTGASTYQRVTVASVMNNFSQSRTADLSTLRGLYPDNKVGTALYYFKTGGGQYIAMGFTGDQLFSDTGVTGFSPGGQQHSGQPMAGFAYMTVSRCAGDFRLRESIGFSDPYMACSSELSGGLDNMVNFDLGNAQSTFQGVGSICTIKKDETYYLNVVFADPRVGDSQSVGLHPNEIVCSGTSTSCGFKFGAM